jgi:hypothetical protein
VDLCMIGVRDQKSQEDKFAPYRELRIQTSAGLAKFPQESFGSAPLTVFESADASALASYRSSCTTRHHLESVCESLSRTQLNTVVSW